MLTRKKVIGTKIETAQGAVVTLAATDFFNALDVQVDPDTELLERLYNSASIDPFGPVTGKKWYAAKFKTPLILGGAAGTPPQVGPLLQACGLVETINGTINVTYAPTSSPISASFYGPGKSCTIKAYEDGWLHVLAGCIGNLKLILEAGKMAMCEWDFKGIYTAVTDAAIPTNTPTATDPPVVKSAAMQLQGYAGVAVSKFEIDFGNTIAELPDINAANSILGYQISGRKPVGSADPLAVLVATHDFYGKFMSGAQASSTITVGSGAGNNCTITLPKTQYGKIAKADRSGVLALNVPLVFNRNSGDDWISIVLT